MTDFDPIDRKLLQINQRFKLAQLGVQLERRGTKLNLRATLPPKPGSARLRPSQQRLSLSLIATPDGLKKAEQEAKVLALSLMNNSFDWREYTHAIAGHRLSQLELSQQIQSFETAFFASPHRNRASTTTTWRSAYAPYLRKLEAIAQAHPSLTLPEHLCKTLESLEPHSRSREIGCTALTAFADFLKLDIASELKPRFLSKTRGNPDDRTRKIRELPDDDTILQHWEKIPNPAWRSVYGIMATFGLRNHEVFYCDYSDLKNGKSQIQVLSTTKTGSHAVWAFPPEWIDRFDLRSIVLPEITTDLASTTLQSVGQRVTAQFRRYGIPFSPYDLRHAWAVRTIHLGLSDSVAAKMMGHSVSVHTRTYHQWLTHRDQQAAVDAALSRRAPTT
jgi:integrase